MKTKIKVFSLAGVIALGSAVPGNNGRVCAQENPDVVTVRTREIRKGRTIAVPNNEFRVVLTTEKSPGETVGLSMDALDGYADGVWIDLNNNRLKDAGEEVTRFGANRESYTLEAQTVTVYGKITVLDCSDNSLTALTTSAFSFLEKLDCSSNQLTVLDVNRCNLLKELICDNNRLALLKTGKKKALERVSCASNNIGEKQMTALMKSLPDRKELLAGEITVDEPLADKQKNVAIRKNWEVMH